MDVGHRDARHFSADGTSGFTIQLPCEFHRFSWFSYLCFLERFPFQNQPTETCTRFHLTSRWASLGFREGKPEADVLHGHASGGAGTIWSPGTGQGNDDADVMLYPPRLTFVNAVPTLGLGKIGLLVAFPSRMPVYLPTYPLDAPNQLDQLILPSPPPDSMDPEAPCRRKLFSETQVLRRV